MRDAAARELGDRRARIGVNTGEVVAGTARAARDRRRGQRRRAARAGRRRRARSCSAPRRCALVARCGRRRGARAARAEGEGRAASPRYRLVAVDARRRPSRAGSTRRWSAASASCALLAGRVRRSAVARRAPASCSRSSAPPGVGKSRLAARVPRRRSTRTVVRGPLPLLRRGHHLLAGRRGREAAAARRELDSAAAAARSRRCSARATRRRRRGDRAGRSASCSRRRRAERPLVVVFDDIHWGEPTFLDLIEHVADLSRDAPILLLCLARPELLDRAAGLGRRQAERDDRAARAARRATRPTS